MILSMISRSASPNTSYYSATSSKCSGNAYPLLAISTNSYDTNSPATSYSCYFHVLSITTYLKIDVKVATIYPSYSIYTPDPAAPSSPFIPVPPAPADTLPAPAAPPLSLAPPAAESPLSRSFSAILLSRLRRSRSWRACSRASRSASATSWWSSATWKSEAMTMGGGATEGEGAEAGGAP